MTNIREYFRKKEKKQGDSLGMKILKHRLVILYRTVLIIAVVAAAVAIVIVQAKNRVYESYEEISSVPRENISGSVTAALGEHILTYSNDGANCVNGEGEQLWNQTFEMQNPIVDIRGDVAAMGDYNGRTIYVMDSSGPLGEIDTKMPIRNFVVSANGVVAAILDDTNITWIYLFDASGNTLAYFKTTMKQSGYPVGITISDNGCLVGVSYLYVDSGVMKSSVAFYNFGPVGQNEIDNFVSGYDYMDSVMPYVRFLGSETAIAVSDDRLVVYSGSQKPVSVADVLLDGEILGVYCGKEYVALVYNDVTGNAMYKADIYNKDGKLADTVMLGFQFSDIIFSGDRVIAYSEQEMLVHTIGRMDKFAGNFRKSVQTLIPGKKADEYVIVTGDSVDTIELK